MAVSKSIMKQLEQAASVNAQKIKEGQFRNQEVSRKDAESRSRGIPGLQRKKDLTPMSAPALPMTYTPSSKKAAEFLSAAAKKQQKQQKQKARREITEAASSAKKQYEEYVGSDEHRNALEESTRVDPLQAAIKAISSPYQDAPVTRRNIPRDDKEDTLRALKDYYEGLDVQNQNDETMQRNLDEIAAMPEEDRANLDKYIMERDRVRTMRGFSGEQQFDTYNANPIIQKYGYAKVRKFAEALDWSRNQDLMQNVEQAGASFGQEHPVLATPASVGANLIGTIAGTLGRAAELENRTGQFKTLDPNNIGSIPSAFAGAARGQVVQNIQGDGSSWLRNLAAMAYQGGMSFADSAARLAASGGSSAISAAMASSGAFSDSIRKYSQNGAAPEQAAAMAFVDAGLEYITEKIPTDKLLKMYKGADKNVIAQVLFQTFVEEPTSEEVNLFASVAAQAAILDNASDKSQKIGALVANGASYQDAEAEYYKELWKEAAETYAVSAFSGFLGGGSAVAGNKLSGRNAQTAAAAQVQQTQKGEAADVSPVHGNTPLSQEAPAPAAVQPMDDRQSAAAAVSQTAAQAAAMAPQSAPAQPMTPEQQNLSDTIRQFTAQVSDSYQQNNRATNSMAQNLLSNPGAISEIEALTGIAVEGTTASQQRNSAKEAINALFAILDGNQSSQQDVQTNPDMAQMPAEQMPAEQMQAEQIPVEQMPAELQPQQPQQPQQQPQQVNDQQPIPDSPIQEPANPVQNQTPAFVADPNQQTDGVQMPPIKGTGAADANFSGLAQYQTLQSDDNTQRTRPGDIRENDVLKTDANGRHVTEFAGNLYGSRLTPDRMTDAIKSIIQDGDLGYDTRTNVQSIENARAAIEASGPDAVQAQIVEHANSGSVQDGDIEKGLLLYAAYAQDPAMQDQASSIIVSLGRIANMSGRNLQLFSLIRRMTPEGQLMAVRKNVAKGIDEINKGRATGRRVDSSGNEGVPQAVTSAVKTARENAGAVIGKAYKKVRYRKGQVEIQWNQLGEPFGFEYAQAVGQKLAKGLENAAKPKKQKTFLEAIESQLRKFASEKMPQQEKAKPLTATELLRDYIQNQSFYAEAWGAAQQTLRDKVTAGGQIDPALLEFVNSGIGVDANNNPKNRIFAKALAAAAIESGETKQMLNKQNALGFTNMADTIANKLIEDTGASGEIADAIRDAAREYVNDQLSQDIGKSQDEILESSIRSAMRDINETLSAVAISGKEAKQSVKERIIETLVNKYGFGAADAEGVADVVGQKYSAMVKAQAEKMLERKFAPKKGRAKRSLSEIFTELANLGAFDVDSSYNAQATAKILGDKYKAEIRPELAQAFLEATTQEQRDKVMDDIYWDVASNIRPTVGEMWDAWRYLSMLGNPKTHIRNVGSNIAFMPYTRLKNDLGAIIESAVIKSRNDRTKAFLNPVSAEDRAILSWAKQDAASSRAEKLMQSSGNEIKDAENSIQSYRKILPGALDKAYKANSYLMSNVEDGIFKRAEYRLALASFLKARGYNAQQLSSGSVPASVLDEGRSVAVMEASRATFNDRSKFSDAMGKLLRKSPDDPLIVQLVKAGNSPFIRIPANIVQRHYEYSPVGLAQTIVTAKSDIESGKLTAADVADRISSGLVGTGAMLLGAALRGGLIPGVELIAEPDDEEKEQGAQSYCIRIGEKYYSLGWLSPAMIPLLSGARFYEDVARMSNDDTGLTGWDILLAIADTGMHQFDPLLELSMMSSLKDAIESFNNEEDFSRGVLSFVVNGTLSYLTQGIPTLLGQAEQATEGEKKQTYVNTDNPLERSIKTSLSSASKKIPGLDLWQTEKLDEFGRPVQLGSAPKRVFDAFLNPFTVTERKDDPVINEINRLNQGQEIDVTPNKPARIISYTDKSGVYHKDFRLSAEQYDTYARTQGDTVYRIMDDLQKNPDYQKLSITQRALAYSAAKEYAAQVAKTAAVPGFQDLTGWMAGIDGNEATTIIQRVQTSAMNNAMSDMFVALSKGWETSKRSDALYSQYGAYETLSPSAKREIYEDAEQSVKKYIDAMDADIDHDKYMDIVKGERALAAKDGRTSLLQADVIAYLDTITGLTDSQKETVLKSNVSDKQDAAIDDVQKIVSENDIGMNYLALYAKVYDAYENYTHGSGKKKRTVEYQADTYNISEEVAEMLYDAVK